METPPGTESQQLTKPNTTTIKGPGGMIPTSTIGDRPVSHTSSIATGTLLNTSYVGAWAEEIPGEVIPQTLDIGLTTRKSSIDGSTSGNSGAVIDAHFMNHRHDLLELEVHVNDQALNDDMTLLATSLADPGESPARSGTDTATLIEDTCDCDSKSASSPTKPVSFALTTTTEHLTKTTYHWDLYDRYSAGPGMRFTRHAIMTGRGL